METTESCECASEGKTWTKDNKNQKVQLSWET